VIIGCTDKDLQRLADPERKPLKAGSRDLAAVCAQKKDAGATVSATCMIAERIGIRIFSTGGIGGVHRRVDALEPADVSSDLVEIARRRVCVVCAGPKAILDLRATAETLESLGVPLWGFRTGELPAFFTEGSGVALKHRFEDVAGVALGLKTHWDVLESAGGVVVCVPPPSPLPRADVEEAIDEAVHEAARRKLPGKEVTPFLLSALATKTRGRTQTANLDLLENNARIAAQLASAMG
jgi:pseudouridine-5'-phosphate glycosidase